MSEIPTHMCIPTLTGGVDSNINRQGPNAHLKSIITTVRNATYNTIFLALMTLLVKAGYFPR